MRRLIRGFAGRTYHIVGNLISRLNCYVSGLEYPLCGDQSNLTNNVTFISTSYFISLVFRNNKAGSNFKFKFNLTFLSFYEGMYILCYLGPDARNPVFGVCEQQKQSGKTDPSEIDRPYNIRKQTRLY